MEETVTISGIQYLLSYDQPITPEQRLYLMEEIRKTSGCCACGQSETISLYQDEDLSPITVSSIISLAPTCPAGSKTKGATITLNAAPSGGIAPYTVTFYKKIDAGAQSQITQVTGVPEGGPVTGPPTYVVLGTDVTGATGDGGATPPLAANKIRIITTATDSCPAGSGGPATSTEICDVTLSCGTITCNATIS